jgi:hypothetical protein
MSLQEAIRTMSEEHKLVAGPNPPDGESEPLPAFASEEEELAFWDTHNPADYFTEPTDVTVCLTAAPGRRTHMRRTA